MRDNNGMELWDRIQQLIEEKHTTQDWVAGKTGRRPDSFRRMRSKNTLPDAEEIIKIAKALGVTAEYLVTGENGHQSNLQTAECQEEDPDVCRIPLLSQKVAAGKGQEFIESSEVIGTVPFLKRMLRGADASTAKALEVRGDSMTGIQLFDGDMVVFVPGSIRGDGIYVLRVNDTLIVKRVEFDEVSRKLRIMSENTRYPDRVESADEQNVEVLGKVYGWLHAHPY